MILKLIFNFYQQFGEWSCVRSTPFARWRCNIRRLHSDEVEMQISTLVQRFILVFVRYLFPYELSFTSCEFGIVTWVK